MEMPSLGILWNIVGLKIFIYTETLLCLQGIKEKSEKGLTQETIIIDKTVLTEADRP